MKRTRPPLRICIATSDIVGPIRNGGIGTGYYALAVALARAGHDVTVLYALGSYCERESIGYWETHYASLGITFVPLPEENDLNLKGSPAVRISYRVHRWLAGRAFDVVHFHEWRGVGYYALLAKRQGLSLQGTTVCVGAHSPSFWHKEGMREIPATVEEFELDFMERESVALADVIWSPSRHMLKWMTSHSWPRPRKSFVLQYLMLDFLEASSATEPSRRSAKPAKPVKPLKIDELVFFGRLETRKGLDVFCDALDCLVARGVSPKRIAFLGKIATVDGVDSREYLERRAAAWPHIACHIEAGFDRDEAIAYLRCPGRAAVLPSRVDNLPLTVLECLGAGIPFISSDVGGIPELVAKVDRPQVLSSLSGEALAKLLERAITRGLAPARPAVPLKKTLALWLDWHQRLPRARATSVAGATGPGLPGRGPGLRALRERLPKVSVCITHRNRPDFLAQALASIRAQSYRQIEVVLVDDGSDQPEALRYLKWLAPEFRKRGWKVVRQPRRFPGAARNHAASQATGEYLLFMDDDNVAKPNEVETLVRAALASGADIATCFLDVFQGTESPCDPRAAVTSLFRWTFLGGCTAVGAVQNCFGDTNCLVKRKVFRAIGGFSEDYGVGFEDWEFLAKAALAGYRVEVVPEALVWYRQTGTGVNSTTALDRNHWRALRPYLEKLPPEQRSLVALAKQRSLADAHTAATEPLKCDHVHTVVVFGAGEGGRLAVSLAQTCGWSVAYIVDNNATLWEKSVHGVPVKSPAALEARDFDLILVASYGGRKVLSSQLDRMGFASGTNYAFFLDSFAVGKLQHRVTP